MVVDRDLIIEVAQALSKDDRTRDTFLQPGSDHCWISLNGEVTTQEVQLAAEEVAGRVGVVTQAIIQPTNRLVSHVVVSESNELVDTESVFLVRGAPPLSAYPVLDPNEYPLSPDMWQPPYPYTSGTVRWRLEEITEKGGLSREHRNRF